MTLDRIELPAGTSIDAARRILSAAFRAQEIDSPELDARILIGHALGLDHAALTVNGAQPLNDTQSAIVAAFAERRMTREPVARIVGFKEFWGLPLTLGPTTLIPRPETETVVEAAIAALKYVEGPARIADLGTGTGAILLALLHELPNAIGVGTDLSVAALEVAQDNAAANALADRAMFAASDFGSALWGGFDCVVSNPPYIAAAEIAQLDPDVRNFDPRLALDGGPDGLSAYRRIAGDARRLLKTGGALVLELGAGQEQVVSSIMSAQQLTPESPARPDLAGIPRALTLRALP